MPRVDSSELDTALAFLKDDEQLRLVLVGTGTNLLGLVQHLTHAERSWFGYYLTGAESVRGPGTGMRVPRNRTRQEVLDDYRAAIAASNAGTPRVREQRFKIRSRNRQKGLNSQRDEADVSHGTGVCGAAGGSCHHPCPGDAGGSGLMSGMRPGLVEITDLLWPVDAGGLRLPVRRDEVAGRLAAA